MNRGDKIACIILLLWVVMVVSGITYMVLDYKNAVKNAEDFCESKGLVWIGTEPHSIQCVNGDGELKHYPVSEMKEFVKEVQDE